MRKRNKILVTAGAAAALALGGGGLAYGSGAVGGEPAETETTATGPDADRAGRVAVESVGGGQASKVVLENEGNVAYAVDVTKPDGSTVEVEIASDFTVVVSGPDSQESPDGTGTEQAPVE